MTMSAIGEPWHPANGGEHLWFFSTHCVNCRHDANLSRGKPLDDCKEDELCDILRRSYLEPVEEWRELENSEVICTNFQSI